MQTDRMIVRDRHDTAVSQEFAVDGLDQPAAIAVAFVRLQVAIKLRVAVTTIQRPAEITLLFDAYNAGTPQVTDMRPRFRHSSGANVAFCDSHVKWYQQNNPPLGCDVTRYPYYNNDPADPRLQ